MDAARAAREQPEIELGPENSRLPHLAPVEQKEQREQDDDEKDDTKYTLSEIKRHANIAVRIMQPDVKRHVNVYEAISKHKRDALSAVEKLESLLARHEAPKSCYITLSIELPASCNPVKEEIKALVAGMQRTITEKLLLARRKVLEDVKNERKLYFQNVAVPYFSEILQDCPPEVLSIAVQTLSEQVVDRCNIRHIEHHVKNRKQLRKDAKKKALIEEKKAEIAKDWNNPKGQLQTLKQAANAAVKEQLDAFEARMEAALSKVRNSPNPKKSGASRGKRSRKKKSSETPRHNNQSKKHDRSHRAIPNGQAQDDSNHAPDHSRNRGRGRGRGRGRNGGGHRGGGGRKGSPNRVERR